MKSCSRSRTDRLLMSSLFLALAALPGCQGVEFGNKRAGTTYGPDLPFGQGAARTYLEQDAEGAPVALGVEFTEAALTTLEHRNTSARLALPAAASRTQYTFVTLDWNPHGHEPPKVYDTPHFDVHFYMIPPSEVERIAGGVDPVVVRDVYVPPGHISPGNRSVPAMGVHWVNAAAPEFNGRPFTNTFIYGASAGQLIFVEPMTTLAFLRSREDFSAEVKKPAQVQRAGWYPTRYRIHYLADRKSYRVELGGLQRREPAN